MKTIVVQNRFNNNSARTLDDSVLDVCIQSVEDWCIENDYEHVVYKDQSMFKTWVNLYDENWKYLAHLKFASIKQAGFDRIVYLDTDILVKGNPPLSDDPFVMKKFTRAEADRVDNRSLINSGIFWGNKDKITQLHEWMKSQNDPETRCNKIKLLFLNRALGVADDRHIADQEILEYYFEDTLADIHNTDLHVLFGMEPIKENCFVHFYGANKRSQYDFYSLLVKFGSSNEKMFKTLENMLFWDKNQSLTHPYQNLRG